MNRKLYRSQTDKVLGGVCGGLGIYLGADPVLIRLFFILLTIFGEGIGILVYLILWLVIPSMPVTEDAEFALGADRPNDLASRAKEMGTDIQDALRSPNPQARLLIGGTLIVTGIYFVIENLNIHWLWWLDFNVLWPLLLIAGGIGLLVRYQREKQDGKQ